MSGVQTKTKEKKTISRITVRRGGSIVLPAPAVKRLGIRSGQTLDVVEHKNALTLVPRARVPKDQKWYYTPRWQKMMKEAFEDVKAGRIAGPFESVEDFIKDLNS